MTLIYRVKLLALEITLKSSVLKNNEFNVWVKLQLSLQMTHISPSKSGYSSDTNYKCYQRSHVNIYIVSKTEYFLCISPCSYFYSVNVNEITTGQIFTTPFICYIVRGCKLTWTVYLNSHQCIQCVACWYDVRHKLPKRGDILNSNNEPAKKGKHRG